MTASARDRLRVAVAVMPYHLTQLMQPGPGPRLRFRSEGARMSRIQPVTLELTGELDITAASALGTALSAAVACQPVIAVDLLPRRPWDAGALPFWTMKWDCLNPGELQARLGAGVLGRPAPVR